MKGIVFLFLISFCFCGFIFAQTTEFNPQETINDEIKIVENYVSRGVAYYLGGNLDKAIADFNKAIEIDPNYAGAYYNRGLTYYRKGEFDQAISDYNTVIEISPSNLDVYTTRGLAYAGKGELDAAISDYNTAIENNPNNTAAYNNRAVAYFLKGEYGKSWKDVHRLEILGWKVDAGFLKDLKMASGRER